MTRIRLLMGKRLKYFWLPICIAVWTILQSVAHAWWIVYGREMLACEIKVKRKVEFYLYLTYLYSVNECDSSALDNFGQIKFNNSYDAIDINSSFSLSQIYKEDGTMTDSLMNLYLGSDAFWIVTSVSLFVGVLMRLKQCSALIFYLPWILVSVVILAVDLFSSLYFGLQLPTAEIIQTSLPWKLEKSTIMAIISGRLGLIWISNICNVVYISWFTRVTYQQRYSDERNRILNHKTREKLKEDRIKRWQIYYGVIDEDQNYTTTTTFKVEEDLNYTDTFKELEEYNKRKKSNGSIPENELCSTFKSSSTVNELAFNQTESKEEQKSIKKKEKKVQITELVSHLPWTYCETTPKMVHKKRQEFDLQQKTLHKGSDKVSFKDDEQTSKF